MLNNKKTKKEKTEEEKKIVEELKEAIGKAEETAEVQDQSQPGARSPSSHEGRHGQIGHKATPSVIHLWCSST